MPNRPSTCQVALIDDHRMLAEGIAEIFRQDARFLWKGLGHSLEDARRLLSAGPVDVLILDLQLKTTDGFEVIRRLGPEYPQTKFLILTMTRNAEIFARLMEAGVVGCVTKDEPSKELVEGVWSIFTRGRYLSPAVQEELMLYQAGRGKFAPGLSVREIQVFLQVGRGLKNQEIASALGVSIKTVETHKENLKRKLGAASTGELVRRAALGLFSDSSASLPGAPNSLPAKFAQKSGIP